ncbi:probable splicing factor, arginine/serine-rich 7 [Bradysia coprophila]|uniref:probable splicing factor, arginine/serine-rich 7 n=1 Tax=Bradysia coprophila TaxID=38358 RepID=UPI00187D893B|nr:probable splicing factor, arginine/serine-rich 7 [Bradysia coprophila]
MTGGGFSTTKVVQITNIAPQSTKDQMMSLFGSIGKIDEIRLYPTIRDVSCPVFSRVCYIKFMEASSVVIAQHLTNTVFIDRALIVSPVLSIPDEFKALEMTNNGNSVPGTWSDSDASLPAEVVNRIDGVHPNQVIRTVDPKLVEHNLPEYPPLPVNAKKIEEIRRTIIVLDVRSDWHLDDLMDHFALAGEIKYATRADKGRDRFVMIEFCEQKSVIAALMMQGTEYKGDLLNVYHSTQAINKPEAKSNEAAQREIEEAMSIVKEAQNMISAAIDPVIGMLSKDKSSSSRRTRSRSRGTSSRRSRSRRSRSRRSRSKRSRSRRSRSKGSRSKRERNRSRSSRKRSPKRSRSRSKRSRSPKDSRSRSKRSRSPKDRRKRSRSRQKSSSRDHRKNSLREERSSRRSRSPSRGSRDHHRSRKQDRHRRSRSRSKHRRSHSKSRSSRPKESSRSSKRRSRTPERSSKLRRVSEERVTRDYDEEEKIGMELDESFRPPEPPPEKSTSPEKSDNMDISNSP